MGLWSQISKESVILTVGQNPGKGVKAEEPTHTVLLLFQNKDSKRLHSIYMHSGSINLQLGYDIYVPYIHKYVWHYTYSLQNLEHP